MQHAKLSPSSAKRWTSCTASPDAQLLYPNETSAASRPGTCGHQIAAECLESGTDADAYLGRVMDFWTDSNGRTGEGWAGTAPAGARVLHTHTVDQSLIDMVQSYVNFVRNLRDSLGAHMIVEQKVGIGHVTGEAGATGTADCILLTQDEIVCIDLKLGRGKVTAYDVLEAATYDPITEDEIPPKLRMNLQAALYIAGAVEGYWMFGDFKRCRAIIVQPALGSVSEYGSSLEELDELLNWLRQRANATRSDPEFVPSSDNCFFCRARHDCHVRNKAVLETALDGFEDIGTAQPKAIPIPKLGLMYEKLDVIRRWCDDIEEKVLAELLAGKRVVRSDGLKYVLKEGRKKNKEWTDVKTVEQMLQSWRLTDEQMFVTKLITPAQAEAIAESKKGWRDKGVPAKPIGKQHWNQLQEYIKQEEGKPVIALETDPRPKFVFKDDGFDDVQQTPEI